MLHLHNARAKLSGEFRFVYEWFAGWRWECHRDGQLVGESLESFESRDDCVNDAKLCGARRATNSAPAAAQPARRDLSERAA